MIHVALRFRASVDCTPVGVNRREANPLSRRPSLEGGRVRVGLTDYAQILWID